MSLTTPILIVGGGIGGLSTALSIASTGRPVRVLEQAPEFSEIGAGIQLAPNALRILDRLGALPATMRDVVRPGGARMMDARTGELLAAMDFGKRFLEAYGYPYVVTHRTDLLDALLQQCKQQDLISLENGVVVDEVVDAGDTAVVVARDGSRIQAPLVVGADGLWSVVRRTVVGDGAPVCRGDVAYRGAVPIELIPHSASLDTVTWWVGPDMHLIQYPVRRGELFNQVGVFTSSRYRPGMDPSSAEWGTPEELDARFDGLDPRVQASAALLNRDRRWALFDRTPAASWTKGRITLVGDAAHPMLQYLAQGACQALEDAWAIGQCLGRHGADVDEALSAYEGARLPRSTDAQTWARRVGDIVHADGVVAMMRNALLRQLTPEDFRYVDWLYADNAGLGVPMSLAR